MIALIHHPAGKERLGDLLLNNLAQPKWHSFRAAIAFLKKSGTKHVCPVLKRFAKRGAVKLSIGIDHNGTSFEGLRELLSSLDKNGEAYIFHNEAQSTFHPKVYFFINDNAAECLIGSGNLTEGGLFTNFEVFADLQTLDYSLQSKQSFEDQLSLELYANRQSTQLQHGGSHPKHGIWSRFLSLKRPVKSTARAANNARFVRAALARSR